MIPNLNLVQFIVEIHFKLQLWAENAQLRVQPTSQTKEGCLPKFFLIPNVVQYLYQRCPANHCQYDYADNQALQSLRPTWNLVESNLTADMADIAKCLKWWGLKLSITKTIAKAFHFNNREINCEITITVHVMVIPNNYFPVYLGIKLNKVWCMPAAHCGLTRKNISKEQPHKVPSLYTWGGSTTTLDCHTQHGVQCRKVCWSCLVSQCVCQQAGCESKWVNKHCVWLPESYAYSVAPCSLPHYLAKLGERSCNKGSCEQSPIQWQPYPQQSS